MQITRNTKQKFVKSLDHLELIMEIRKKLKFTVI